MYHLNNDEVINLYRYGWSMQSLSKRYNVSHSVIKRTLLSKNIALRSISDSVIAMLKADPTIYDRIVPRRKMSLNENYFEILTPEVAYIIGLIQADGNIRYSSRNHRLTLAFKSSDADFLQTITHCLGSNHKICEVIKPFGKCVRVEICSKRLVKSLIGWGIKPNKSHIASTHPSLLLNRDYWRGVIDGDGSLCVSSEKNKILSLVGSRSICNEFLSFCKHFECFDSIHVNKHKNIFSIQMKNGRACKIAYILYNNAKLYIPRKMEIYQKYFASNGGHNGT